MVEHRLIDYVRQKETDVERGDWKVKTLTQTSIYIGIQLKIPLALDGSLTSSTTYTNESTLNHHSNLLSEQILNCK